MNSFGQRLKALRKEIGVSQAFLAEQIGISVQSVSNWECDNTLPDISQIVPLASLLSVSTDYLLGVGTNESRDKAELNAEVDRIWATYSVNTEENNADLLAYEAYRQYLIRYPLDYEVKYKCALAISDYLLVSAERKKFDVPQDKWERFYAESARLLRSVCESCTLPELHIDAEKAFIALLLMKKQWNEAETAALQLPETCGIRAEALRLIAQKKGDPTKERRYAGTACKMKLTDYTYALFYRAKALSIQPETEKESALAAWKEMQEAAEKLTELYADPSDLAVNAYEKNPFCYLITSFTACSNFLLDRGDVPKALICVGKATDAAVRMVAWTRMNCDDKLVLSDVLFFAEHTPGWCVKWASAEAKDTIEQSETYRAAVERIQKAIGEA